MEERLNELKERIKVVMNEKKEIVTDEPVIGALNVNAQIMIELIDILKVIAVPQPDPMAMFGAIMAGQQSVVDAEEVKEADSDAEHE